MNDVNPFRRLRAVPDEQQLSPDSLLAAAARGDEAAFSGLYDALAATVHGVVLPEPGELIVRLAAVVALGVEEIDLHVPPPRRSVISARRRALARSAPRSAGDRDRS